MRTQRGRVPERFLREMPQGLGVLSVRDGGGLRGHLPCCALDNQEWAGREVRVFPAEASRAPEAGNPQNLR